MSQLPNSQAVRWRPARLESPIKREVRPRLNHARLIVAVSSPRKWNRFKREVKLFTASPGTGRNGTDYTQGPYMSILGATACYQ